MHGLPSVPPKAGSAYVMLGALPQRDCLKAVNAGLPDKLLQNGASEVAKRILVKSLTGCPINTKDDDNKRTSLGCSGDLM